MISENTRINSTSLTNNSSLEGASSAVGGGGGIRSNITLEYPAVLSAPAVIQHNNRHRFAALSCISGSNVNNGGDEDFNVGNNNQFIVNRQEQQRQELTEEEHNQRRRQFLCRTPPPNYHSLPSTPPPSYTQNSQVQQQISYQEQQTLRLTENSRDYNNDNNVNNYVQQEHSPEQQQQLQPLSLFQVPEAFAPQPYAEQNNLLNRLNVGSNNRTNESVVVNRQQILGLANGRCATRNVATVSQNHHHQQQQQHHNQQQLQQIQQRRRKQRRRNLYLLQQQQQQLQQQQQQHQQQHQQQQHNHLNLDNHNINSDSSTSLTDASESDNDIISIGNTRDQRRRRRQRLLKLRDAYCPDLLNACSLILLQQQTSDSTVGSFTDTPPPPPQAPHERYINDSTDSVEYQHTNRRRNGEQNKTQSLSQIYEPINLCEADTYGAHHNNRLNGARVDQEREVEDEEENQRLYYNNKEEMGQNLSIRRPRISLTWVLREQSQNQQQQQQNDQQPNTKQEEEKSLKEDKVKKENTSDLNNVLNNNQIVNKSINKLDGPNGVEKKKYRLKHIPSNSEPLNGYATTPTGYTNTPNALGSQKFFSNQNLLEYHKDEVNYKPASKDLLFVCTPQRVPESFGGSALDVLALAKKRNEIRKKLAMKMAHFRSETQTPRLVNNISNDVQLKKDNNKSSLKSGSYSEPSLIAASEGNSRRHRHRKRRERNRSQKFGYEIKNVDEFLNKCSLATPGNIPMVLSTSCILYQTRPGGYQTEISLPLGMVVNAVFKNQNWLYVQTPHSEEGYVNYNTCLPLGILPPEARKESSNHSKPTPCWENNGDIFPKPCGNMTDSEKEIHLRVGSRSEGARTPHLKNSATDNDTATVISVKTENTDCLNGNTTATSSMYGEQQVDKLYLRAASQPKLNEKTSYAQLKIIRNHSSAKSQSSVQTNDEYVTLQQQKQQQHQFQHQQQQPHQIKQKHLHGNNQKTYITRTFITNGHNGQHLHPKDMKINIQQHHNQQQQQSTTNCNLKASNSTTMLQQQQQINTPTTITVTSSSLYSIVNNKQQQQQHQQQHHHQQQQQHQSQSLQLQQPQQHHTLVAPRSVLNAIRRSTAHCGQRQTLVAITTDYITDALTLHKGDIVTLCECRETKDHRQWFYVRTRDGRQGYIPAEVAGHGYL
ncbi:uncharacterized protein ACRADG_003273 [Cochliomyia hominivorax]